MMKSIQIKDRGIVYTPEEARRAIIFVRHIQSHLEQGESVICKICNKNIHLIELDEDVRLDKEIIKLRKANPEVRER